MEFGKRCLIKVADYPQPVFIFIPKQFDGEKTFSLLLYFHGHLLPNTTYQTDVLDRFQFEQKLAKIKRNLIMVMPLSTGLDQDYDDYFFKNPKAKENFLSFTTSLNNTLQSLGLNLELQKKLILGGHSGAYRHLATFVGYDLPKLNELYLFDCLYDKYDSPKIFGETFSRFQNENKRFLSFYKIGSSTDQANFASWMVTKDLTQQASKSQFYKESLNIDKINSQTIPQQSFIKTNKTHYQIVEDFFIWALESGELNQKKSLR